MVRRTVIPTVGAITIGLVASLVLATPAPAARPDLQGASYRYLPMPASVRGAGVEDPDPHDVGVQAFSGVAAGGVGDMNAGALARWRRRGSTMDRCERTPRRPTPDGPAGPRRVVSHDQVALGGCRYFLQYGTLDMDELAMRLAISRATLYRVVHSRDRLLADVLWRLAENAVWRARKERSRTGVDGVLDVGRRVLTLLLDAKPLRTFLTSEPDVAARVLLTATGGVHHRAVQAQKEILIEAAAPGQCWRAEDLDAAAYLIVRIFESTLYADLLATRPPDRDLAERAIRAVLADDSMTI